MLLLPLAEHARCTFFDIENVDLDSHHNESIGGETKLLHSDQAMWLQVLTCAKKLKHWLVLKHRFVRKKH